MIAPSVAAYRFKLLPRAGVPAQSLPRHEVVAAVVQEAYDKFKNETRGKNADYIPYLAQVDSKLFGIAIVTTDNQVITIGDVKYSFSIQSISKVYTLAMAMEALGADKVFEKVGSEPTGRPFNSPVAVVDMPTHTGNPLCECWSHCHHQSDFRQATRMKSGTRSWISTAARPEKSYR